MLAACFTAFARLVRGDSPADDGSDELEKLEQADDADAHEETEQAADVREDVLDAVLGILLDVRDVKRAVVDGELEQRALHVGRLLHAEVQSLRRLDRHRVGEGRAADARRVAGVFTQLYTAFSTVL